MSTYNIKFTDINKTPIIIDQGTVDVSDVDIALFGRIDLEYGELLNENLLHLLENFACPEDPDNIGNPDLSVALNDTLSHPTEGQIWYNATQGIPFSWDGTEWQAIGSSTDFAANSGKIYHGQQIPLPVSSSGYQFTYDECIWIVTPSGIQATDLQNSGFSYMVCTTTNSGLVNHQYTIAGSNVLVSAIANYLIIGMRGSSNAVNVHNHNYDTLPPPPPPLINATVTPTPSPTATPAGGATATPTPTPSATVSPTITVTPTITRTPPITPTISRTPSATPFSPISATLFLNPSIGMAQTFGSTSTHFNNCNTTVVAQGCKSSLEVWIANLTGGDGGPYTVSWNLNYFYVVTLAAVDAGDIFVSKSAAPFALTGLSPWAGSTYNGSLNGYNCHIGGVISNIIGGSGLRTNAFCILNYILTGLNTTSSSIEGTGSITLLAGSSVTIADNSGHSVTYFTPGGSGGQVQGTQLLTAPLSNYTDSYSLAMPATGKEL